MIQEVIYIYEDGSKVVGETRGLFSYKLGQIVHFLKQRYHRNNEDGQYVLAKKHTCKIIHVNFRRETIEEVVNREFQIFRKIS